MTSLCYTYAPPENIITFAETKRFELLSLESESKVLPVERHLNNCADVLYSLHFDKVLFVPYKPFCRGEKSCTSTFSLPKGGCCYYNTPLYYDRSLRHTPVRNHIRRLHVSRSSLCELATLCGDNFSGKVFPTILRDIAHKTLFSSLHSDSVLT